MTADPYAPLDEALARLFAYGPDLANGLTSHAPMAVEALCALGRPGAVMPWIERYRPGLLPRPAPRERIDPEGWRAALARPERFADWGAFFAEALREAPWPEVLDRWVDRLAPGLCASAAHGVIRVGHAARGLARGPSAPRLAELADALASWASTYQELPTREAPGEAGRAGRRGPRAAIARVPVVPPERRRFTGTIVSSLEGLAEFPEFAPVIGWVDPSGDPARRVAELAEVFTRVYLANAHDVLTTIVFVHGVTAVAAVESLLPSLRPETARRALRFAWQTGCGLYAAFGRHPEPPQEVEADGEDDDALIERAVAHGDEHVIKFTEACLRPREAGAGALYRAAACHALGALPVA
jgi:Questin oxidase-like